MSNFLRFSIEVSVAKYIPAHDDFVELASSWVYLKKTKIGTVGIAYGHALILS